MYASERENMEMKIYRIHIADMHIKIQFEQKKKKKNYIPFFMFNIDFRLKQFSVFEFVIIDLDFFLQCC